MGNSQQVSDSRDYERLFYTVLSESWESDPPPQTDRVEQDFFDARNGVQSGFTADGVPVVLITLTNEGVKMVTEGVRHWNEHQCSSGTEVGLFLAHVIAEVAKPLLEHLPDLKHYDPFPHAGGKHQEDDDGNPPVALV